VQLRWITGLNTSVATQKIMISETKEEANARFLALYVYAIALPAV